MTVAMSVTHCQRRGSKIEPVYTTLWFCRLQSSLRSIPDLTFTAVGRLRTLDLSDNALERVTQRSLAGLHGHLEIIKLDNNRLTTLDHCVFYRFDNIDLLKVYSHRTVRRQVRG